MAIDLKRKHVRNGKPRGGARPGAGRPKGSKDILPKGAVKALQALSLRVPADAHPEAKELADRALFRIADVMEGKVHQSIATPVLKAATTIREEVCGPIVRKIELDAKVGISAILDEMANLPDGSEEGAAAAASEAVIEAEVVAKGPIVRKKGSTVQ